MTGYRDVVRARGGGAALRVRVTPRSRRQGLDGVHGEAVRLRVAAPPVGGKANAAVVALLADLLDVDTRSVTIAAGVRSRTKTVHVDGLDADQVAARLTARS
jgi:hypothetical protein